MNVSLIVLIFVAYSEYTVKSVLRLVQTFVLFFRIFVLRSPQ